MSASRQPTSGAGEAFPFRGSPRPSATRSASVRRVRAGQEALRGNTRALKHGVFAEVSAQEDVATEVVLIFATRPGLDPVEDARLVEQLALNNVQRQRVLIAMQQPGGLNAVLTSYDARLAPLVERLEQKVYEREQQRIASRRRNAGPVDLSKYSTPSREEAAS